MDQGATPAVIGGEGTDLAWELTKLNAGGPVTVDAELVAAYQAASSRHTLRGAGQRPRGVRPVVPPLGPRHPAGFAGDGRRLS